MSQLSDYKVDIKLRLGALWTSTMFCYIYCDYFELYRPGKLESMLRGVMGPGWQITQELLLATSLLMAIPSLMIFLSVALPARRNRILNIIVGSFFTILLALLTFSADWLFYRFFAGIEAVLSALVVWNAWKWPKIEGAV